MTRPQERPEPRAHRPVKIVATIGPASRDSGTIARLIGAGVDVVRLNLSHGTWASHREAARVIRRESKAAGRHVMILADLPGPKIRLGALPGGRVSLAAGETVRLSGTGVTGALPVLLPRLADAVAPGDRILLADGAVELEVERVADNVVSCVVTIGGAVSSRKGISLPSASWAPAAFTPADRKALALAIDLGADAVALSFVGAASDIAAARRAATRLGAAGLPFVAKIETRRALADLEAIVAAADGVMVARGDLGVEIPPEEVPPAQRRIVAAARRAARPVIVATQMLVSMVVAPRPTRAEAADVAGAVWEGADAVMLSEETAVGSHPVEAVGTMARIIASAAREAAKDGPADAPDYGTSSAIGRAACQLARDLRAAAIVAATESGHTALMVSRHRPPCPIVGLTPNRTTARRLSLLWGVTPVLRPSYASVGDMTSKAAEAARTLGLASPGDLLVCTAGLPFRQAGTTNLIRVVEV
jgi:pyruvate kinase